jgi:hypothetical protein
MPALAAITLQNNAAANVVFSPVTIDTKTGVVSWATANAVYDAKSTVTFSMVHPKGNSTRVRIREKVVIPVMDAVDVNKKVDECIASVEISLPKTATQLQRLDLRKYIDTLLTNAITTAAIDTFEGVY